MILWKPDWSCCPSVQNPLWFPPYLEWKTVICKALKFSEPIIFSFSPPLLPSSHTGRVLLLLGKARPSLASEPLHLHFLCLEHGFLRYTHSSLFSSFESTFKYLLWGSLHWPLYLKPNSSIPSNCSSALLSKHTMYFLKFVLLICLCSLTGGIGFSHCILLQPRTDLHT